MRNYFEFTHLPDDLAATSAPFCNLAAHLMETYGENRAVRLALLFKNSWKQRTPQ